MATVLVVEDDPSTAALVSLVLERVGHVVLRAASPKQALLLLEEKGALDAAVLDVGLPGMDGFELLTAIRRHPNLENLPAVFLSGYAMPEEVERGKSLNAAYLTKPFERKALVEALDYATSGKEGPSP